MKTAYIGLVVFAAASSSAVSATEYHEIITNVAQYYYGDAEFLPNAWNLNTCPDNGVVNVKLNTSTGLDATRIAGLDPSYSNGLYPGRTEEPVLIPFDKLSGKNQPGVDADVQSVPINKASFTYDTNGNITGVTLFYLTCIGNGDGNGLTEIITRKKLIDNATVDVVLLATTITTGGAASSTVIEPAELDHKVTKLPY